MILSVESFNPIIFSAMSALHSIALPPSYCSSWSPLLHMPPWLQSRRRGISMPATTVPRANTTASIYRPLLQVAVSTITTAPRWRPIKRKFSPSLTVHHGALSPFEFDLSIALPSLRLLIACKPRIPCLTEKAFPCLLGVSKKKFRRRTKRRIQPEVAKPNSFYGDVWFHLLDSSRTVRLLCVPILDGFSFSSVHSSPLQHERHWYPHQACYILWSFPLILLSNLGTRFLLRG
jgi:hypothetical protein